MAWGGSLNKEGSDYVRNLRDADKALKFLEGLKRKLNEKEKQMKAAYNQVFSDALILKEQLETASWFEGTGNRQGQEW